MFTFSELGTITSSDPAGAVRQTVDGLCTTTLILCGHRGNAVDYQAGISQNEALTCKNAIHILCAQMSRKLSTACDNKT
jgi:hypothetical protein